MAIFLHIDLILEKSARFIPSPQSLSKRFIQRAINEEYTAVDSNVDEKGGPRRGAGCPHGLYTTNFGPKAPIDSLISDQNI